MDAAPSLHPTDQTLRSYGLGKLDDRATETVDDHLRECGDCRKKVAEMSADSFLRRVRDAQQPQGESPAGQSRAGGAQNDKRMHAPAPPPADALPPGLAANPDYQVKKELGRGGMGVVYLAYNKLMGRDEVLKVMGQHLMDRHGVLERFLREIQSVARLRHPNIVTAYHATRLDGSIVFAMEYVEGLDLSRLVKTKGPMPVAHACHFIHQAALGLQHAHEEGLVHRDIKPHNLMLSRKGDKAIVKILDFGLAKAAREEKVEGGLTAAGQALGTPDYIAPEQILDATTADIRADIYSLGSTLYYLLTGHPPFQAKSLYDLYQAHISRDADPLNLVRAEVPAELAALVAKMMAKDPARRFQTPGEVAQALTPFFKKGSAALKTSPADISQSGPANASRSAAAPADAATSVETDADRRMTRPGKAAESSVAESRWESMLDFPKAEGSQDAAPAVVPTRRLPWVWPSVVVGVLLLGFLAAWLGGVFKVKTPDGLIVLENVPKDSEILVDGNKITFTWPGADKGVDIRAVPGQHTLEVKKDGFSTFVKEATFKSEGSEAVTVRLEPLVVVGPEPKTPDKLPEPKPVNEGGPAQSSDGSRPASPVAILSGTWRVEGNELVQTGGAGTILLGDTPLSSYDLQFQGQIVSGNEGFNALFHRTSQDNVRFLHVGELAGKRVDAGFMFNGKEGGQSRPVATVKGHWYDVLVKVRGPEYWCYLDGQELFHDVDDRFTNGRIGLATWDGDARYRDIRVATPDGKTLWEGPPELPGQTVGGTAGTGSSAQPPIPVQGGGDSIITSSIGMKLALIPAGEFLMGSPDSDRDAGDNEMPQHRVRITRPFYLGVHEVTQGQYRAITGANPSEFKGSDDLPVENVSWNDTIAFCDKLSVCDGLKPFDHQHARGPWDGEGYRLPTEAEWEYACRAGSTTKYGFGENAASLGEFAWYDGNSGNKTHPVGQKRPNSWGLFDMHGNVWEWCWDGYKSDYYKEPPVVDPSGPSGATARVFRGGGWDDFPRNARSAFRYRRTPEDRYFSLGFRVARVQAGQLRDKVQLAAVAPPPANAVPNEPKEITNSIKMKLVLIPSGEFLMGAPDLDRDAGDAERPQHRVKITRPFYLAATEVTQRQYQAVMGQNPSKFRFKGSDNLPVEQVTWRKAVAFCDKLCELEEGQLAGARYRLPTEAEWEYACRAKSPARYSFGDDPAGLGAHAWFVGNSGLKTHPVGQKRPNAFGLFDMHGNVWEWCFDGRDGPKDDFYKRSPVDDPVCPGWSGSLKQFRGGSWRDDPGPAQSATRACDTPEDYFATLGFRVARDLRP